MPSHAEEPESLKSAFDRARSAAVEAHRSGRDGRTVVAQHAAAVDEILLDVFRRSAPDESHIALVALGGYGRRELAPYSDLDVLLLHAGRRTSSIEDVNRRFMYPLWDAGCDVGNRVRDVREVVRMLDRVDEASAVLDARFIAGDHLLFADLDATVQGVLERSRAAYFRSLVAATAGRHAQHGHLGHLLEPDVRESAGGLRDIQTLSWAARLLPQITGTTGLVAEGYLSEPDHRTLLEAAEFLLRIRVELHVRAGRRQDRLYLAEQDEAASRLGYEGRPGAGPGDELMRDLYVRARAVDAVVSSVWERLTQRRARFRRPGMHVLGDGCVVRSGRLEVVAATAPSEDPNGWLRVFLHAARSGLHVARTSLNRLQSAVAVAATPRWTPEARATFLDILGCGTDALWALEAMDATGLLTALIPDWEPVRCLPQRNLYHRYTVDVHSFTAVAELVGSKAVDDPTTLDAWSRTPDPSPLLLAALLHDIGKGRGGDHVELGAELAAATAGRMGLDERVASDVVFLVRNHLVLAELATRRDLNDERTVREAAARTGSPERLAMLYLLTRADALATGPEAWSAFRASLVRELCARTMRALELGVVESPEGGRARARVEEELERRGYPPADAHGLVELMPSSWPGAIAPERAAMHMDLLRTPPDATDVRLAVTPGPDADEVVLVARDRPGLFAVVSGVLAVRGINVLAADIHTRSDGVAIEVFRVSGAYGAIPADRWEMVRADVIDALAGRLRLERELERKAAEQPSPVVAASAPAVVIDNEASDRFTVVEVHATDRLGLLSTITATLRDVGCDVARAKVATYGTHVVDVFYLSDLEGRRIVEPDRVAGIRDALLAALAAETSA